MAKSIQWSLADIVSTSAQDKRGRNSQYLSETTKEVPRPGERDREKAGVGLSQNHPRNQRCPEAALEACPQSQGSMRLSGECCVRASLISPRIQKVPEKLRRRKERTSMATQEMLGYKALCNPSPVLGENSTWAACTAAGPRTSDVLCMQPMIGCFGVQQVKFSVNSVAYYLRQNDSQLEVAASCSCNSWLISGILPLPDLYLRVTTSSKSFREIM